MAGWVALLGKALCPALHSQQECHRLALPCTHRESTAARGTGQGSGVKELERTAHAGNPGAAHSSSKAVLLAPRRQPVLLGKELKELSSLSSARKGTTECYYICIANAIIELSIPQGDHSTESDAEVSDIIFQRT